VLIDKISAGPITLIVIGVQTNIAIFLMNNPHLKKNVEHIYIMGGGVRSRNPTGCCPQNASSSCVPKQCGDRGNLFTNYKANPYAEFNIFGDPFAAYQVSLKLYAELFIINKLVIIKRALKHLLVACFVYLYYSQN